MNFHKSADALIRRLIKNISKKHKGFVVKQENQIIYISRMPYCKIYGNDLLRLLSWLI